MTKEIQAAYNPYNPQRIRVPALTLTIRSADDELGGSAAARGKEPLATSAAVDVA